MSTEALLRPRGTPAATYVNAQLCSAKLPFCAFAISVIAFHHREFVWSADGSLGPIWSSPAICRPDSVRIHNKRAPLAIEQLNNPISGHYREYIWFSWILTCWIRFESVWFSHLLSTLTMGHPVTCRVVNSMIFFSQLASDALHRFVAEFA